LDDTIRLVLGFSGREPEFTHPFRRRSVCLLGGGEGETGRQGDGETRRQGDKETGEKGEREAVIEAIHLVVRRFLTTLPKLDVAS
jgi:hypothetical protein